MSKDILTAACNSGNADNFVWSMCFYKIDHRAKGQPYKFYKIRFKNDEYLLTYAKTLMDCVNTYQIFPIETVQEYDGENTKVSCDKIALANELISTQWTNFVDAFGKATDEKIKGKINGYVLFGEDKSNKGQTITFIKTANPITNLTNKKSIVFTSTVDDELEIFADTVCRLFFNTDIVVIGQTMYTYNHNFEALFDLEKTMAKVRAVAIDKIVATNSIADTETFKTYAAQYTSNRTFITLRQERIDRVKDNQKRKEVALMLKINLDESGDFIIDCKEKASYLIKYLCYKIFKDGETNDVLEASTINTLTIS